MLKNPAPAGATQRVLEMDAVRGAAMFAVCLAHSGNLVADRSIVDVLKLSGLVATPTFLLLSGVVCGYLSRIEGGSMQRARWRLIDRGAFLLLVAHLALGLTHALWMPADAALLQSFYITDAVGLSLIVAGALLPWWTARRLLLGGALLYAVSLVINATWAFRDLDAPALMKVLFGAQARDHEGYVVPAIPYLGIFLMGIAAGLTYSRARNAGVTLMQVARLCLWAGVVGLIGAAALKLAGKMLAAHVDADWRTVIYLLTMPRQKLPPGPTYLLGFGSLGALMTGTLVYLAQTRWRRLPATFAVVGRASLITYVMQSYFLVVPSRIFDLPDSLWVWVLIAPASFCALWTIAYFWDAARLNRFLTVGLRRFERPAVVTTTEPVMRQS